MPHKLKMKNYLILVFILVGLSVKAQYTIVGTLKDTANEDVDKATVMLLNTKDSTLVNFTTSDSKGNFAFKNIKKTDYILKISHISYMPQEILINSTDERELNVGIISLKPIAQFLMEIVIREAKAPIFIRGDTVEYDASTFKVPPGSTIEDLLRRLPGIDVDASGNISTMGKDVKTVYVDGKAFFGNDPKTVTQNLDAAAVSKVQVFTEKSEQEKITGIADGSREKVMNIKLKDEYKKGYFGKATLGYGWGENAPNRWLAKGNFNWFTDKQQLSFIGYGNNLNENSYDWGDMQEFYGQSMQSMWSDDGDFGFESGRSSRRYPFSNYYYSDGSGFSNNGGGGTNYNYYHKKVKFNVGYFYSLNKTFSDVFSNRQTFLQDSTFWRIDTTHNDNFRQNHSFSTRFEYQIDSSNNIILKANLTYSPTERENIFTQLYQTSEFLDINLHSVHNKYENDNLNFNLLTIYNHKFKKKGRNFAISGAYDLSNGNNIENINNINEFFTIASPNEQIKFIVKNNKNTEDNDVKSSILYVEPLSKRISLMGFYNFNNSLSINKNASIDAENATDIDSLWLNYRNNTLYNRVGTSLNYAHNGINLQLGGAFQSLILDGKCEIKPPSIDKQNFIYNNFIPYFSANLDLPKNFYVNIDYSYKVSEPDISYLFPMPNLSNTMYKVLGNPNLKPERYHEMSWYLSYWNSASMVNFSLSGSANFYENQIAYNQNTEFIDKQGYVTISKPENVNGGKGFYSNFWSSFPIVKTKLTMNISANGRINNSPVFINQIENNTNSKSYSANLGLNLTVGQKLSFYAGGNVSQTFTKYSIQSDRDQSYINYGASVNGKWQVFKKTFLEANYRFSNYSNKKLEFNQNINMLNVSVRQVLGKKNQWELRLAAMDILNQNQSIRQIAAVNYIEYRTSPTLARYFLLTAAYNIKGFETKNNKRGYY